MPNTWCKNVLDAISILLYQDSDLNVLQLESVHIEIRRIRLVIKAQYCSL